MSRRTKGIIIVVALFICSSVVVCSPRLSMENQTIALVQPLVLNMDKLTQWEYLLTWHDLETGEKSTELRKILFLKRVELSHDSYVPIQNHGTILPGTVWEVDWLDGSIRQLYETTTGLFLTRYRSTEFTTKLLDRDIVINNHWNSTADSSIKITDISSIIWDNKSYTSIETYEMGTGNPSVYTWATGLGLIYHKGKWVSLDHDRVLELEYTLIGISIIGGPQDSNSCASSELIRANSAKTKRHF